MVGVDLGLRAGGQVLAAVLPHRGEPGGGDCLAVRGREIDLLGGELGVHFVPDEGMGPGQQHAGRDQLMQVHVRGGQARLPAGGREPAGASRVRLLPSRLLR